MPLHELDQARREKAAFFRATGVASEAFILRLLLQPATRKPAWEEEAENLLMEYGDWTLVPDEALERHGVTRGQLYGKVMDSSWVGQPTYAKIVSLPPPRGWRIVALAPVIPIPARAQASLGRRVVRRRRTTATRRGPPSQEDSEPSPRPVVELAAVRAGLRV